MVINNTYLLTVHFCCYSALYVEWKTEGTLAAIYLSPNFQSSLLPTKPHNKTFWLKNINRISLLFEFVLTFLLPVIPLLFLFANQMSKTNRQLRLRLHKFQFLTLISTGWCLLFASSHRFNEVLSLWKPDALTFGVLLSLLVHYHNLRLRVSNCKHNVE